jgi:D-aspartate ligase
MKDTFAHKAPAVVLGLGQNGLATVRALARNGVPVIGVDGNLRQPTARTRLCRTVACKDFRGEGLLDCLLDLGRTLPEKGVLFPSGDISLELVSEKREALAEYFSFALPDKEVMRLAMNKKPFYRFCQEKGFLVPRTYWPQSEAEVEKICSEISFPCIIKPCQPDAAWRKRFPDTKVFELPSAKQLMSHYRSLSAGYPELIVQEAIPGPDSFLPFSLTYFDGEKSLGMFTGRKLRQWPPFYGTSCMAESHWNSHVAEETLRLLRAISYRGYGSVEFKWDPRDERFKIIELTPRSWFPHGLSTACGMNLTYVAYRHICGLPVEVEQKFVEGVKWIHEERDIQSALRMWRQGKLGLGEWLTSYRGRRAYALAAWDDRGPIIAAAIRLLKQPLSSLRARLRGEKGTDSEDAASLAAN